MEKICPVCESDYILLPHGVCKRCFHALKCSQVKTREEIELAEKQIKRTYDVDINEIIKCKLDSQLKEWDKLIENGLLAVDLLTIIVDEAEHLPSERQWHKRRVAFVCDLIKKLDIEIFKPITTDIMDKYLQSAMDYWDGNVSEDERERIYCDFKQKIDKKTRPSVWDEKSLPLWLLKKEESFDWMWYQFMDCVLECISNKKYILEDKLIELYKKHFNDVIIKWLELDNEK